MDFKTYQQKAMTTNLNTSKDHNDFMHRSFGVVGEAGEFAEKIKKVYRDNDGVFDETAIAGITAEMGDILWYLASVADFFDVELTDIATDNLERLQSRKKRNKLHGSGDNR